MPDDPLVTLRAIVMERRPVAVRWRPTGIGLVSRQAVGVLAWHGVDLTLVIDTGERLPIPLATLIEVRSASGLAASGRIGDRQLAMPCQELAIR